MGQPVYCVQNYHASGVNGLWIINNFNGLVVYFMVASFKTPGWQGFQQIPVKHRPRAPYSQHYFIQALTANIHDIVKTTCRAGCSVSQDLLSHIKKFCWNVKAYKFVLP
jgi:hypothetical protein